MFTRTASVAQTTRIEAARATFEAWWPCFAAQPHPYRGEGYSLADFLAFLFRCRGLRSRLKAAGLVERYAATA